MLLKRYEYTLDNGDSLFVEVYHNRAGVCLAVWDNHEEEWYSVSRWVYLWEQPSELLQTALDLAEEHAPDVIPALQVLFSHPDFE